MTFSGEKKKKKQRCSPKAHIIIPKQEKDNTCLAIEVRKVRFPTHPHEMFQILGVVINS
jgi:hypothetical protein